MEIQKKIVNKISLIEQEIEKNLNENEIKKTEINQEIQSLIK